MYTLQGTPGSKGVPGDPGMDGMKGRRGPPGHPGMAGKSGRPVSYNHFSLIVEMRIMKHRVQLVSLERLV